MYHNTTVYIPGLHLGGGGGGGGGEGHSPPLAGCLPPLEIYSMALAYRVCLPGMPERLFCPPLKKILNAALSMRYMFNHVIVCEEMLISF